MACVEIRADWRRRRLPAGDSSDYPLSMSLTLTIELEREAEGRWIAEIPALPGVMVYGESPEHAVARVEALALRVLADEIEHGERSAEDLAVSFPRRAA